MRSVLAAILVFEAIVVGLAVPVAIGVSGVSSRTAVAAGAGLAVAALVTCALLRFRAGVVVGSVLQVVAVALGFVVPVMFVLGAAFAALWFLCVVLDRRVAAVRASRDAAAGPGGSPDDAGDSRAAGDAV